jgi:hypothetical protein
VVDSRLPIDGSKISSSASARFFKEQRPTSWKQAQQKVQDFIAKGPEVEGSKRGRHAESDAEEVTICNKSLIMCGNDP